MKLEEQVAQITAINHAWKRQREIFNANDSIPMMLQRRKASLQVELLRRFPREVYLQYADDNSDGTEPLYSVRLKPISTSSRSFREDAEHLPVRIAEELLTKNELIEFVKGAV